MRKCLKNISSSDDILKATCFTAWSGSIGGSARDAERKEIEEYKRIAREQEALAAERAAASKAKAQAALERQFLGQDAAMKKKIMVVWTTLLEDARLAKANKDKAMTQTLRNIAGGAEMMKTMCFQAWSGLRMS